MDDDLIIEKIESVKIESNLKDSQLKESMMKLSNDFTEFKDETKKSIEELDKKIDETPQKVIDALSAIVGKWFIRFLIGGGIITISCFLIRFYLKNGNVIN